MNTCDKCGNETQKDREPTCCASADAAARNDCGCGGPELLLCSDCWNQTRVYPAVRVAMTDAKSDAIALLLQNTINASVDALECRGMSWHWAWAVIDAWDAAKRLVETIELELPSVTEYEEAKQ